jgi:DNA ligase 1
MSSSSSSKTKTKTQSSLDGFFGLKTSAVNVKQESPSTPIKENSDHANGRNTPGDDFIVPVVGVRETARSSITKRKPLSDEAKIKRRRRVIDDSSSSEDEGAAPSADKDACEEDHPLRTKPIPEPDHDDDEKVKPATQSPAPPKRTTTTKVSTDSTKVVMTKKGQQPSPSPFPPDPTLLDQIAFEWRESEGRQLPYSILCQLFSQIEAITSRLQIQDLLTTLFRKILVLHNHDQTNDTKTLPALGVVHDLYSTVYLASNSVAPACQNVELGIGDSLLIKAIGEATGTSPAMVKQKYETIGDLGSVAQSYKSKQTTLGGFFFTTNSAVPLSTKSKSNTTTTANNKKKGTVLTAAHVLQVFRDIAHTKGSHSQKQKVDKIKGLLVMASEGIETRYIIRGLQGKLRIGLAQSTVLISLAQALALTTPEGLLRPVQDDDDGDYIPAAALAYADKELPVEKRMEAAVAIIKKAYSEVPSYDALLDAALTVPLERLHQKCTLTCGIPVSPMLAKPTKSIQQVLKRLDGVRFTCEYKYDGERAQVHLLPDGTTKVFSRNLLDTSEKYPEVPDYVREAASSSNNQVTSYVMDAEVVAFNPKTGQLVPFQILSTRKKTVEVSSSSTAESSPKVQVILQAFDLMYLNGQSLLRKTLRQRRELLRTHFVPVPGKFQFAKSMDLELGGSGDQQEQEEPKEYNAELLVARKKESTGGGDDTTLLEEFLEQAVKGQCEGLMIKTLDENAWYEPSRRSLNWLKLKKDYMDGLGDSVDLCVLGAYHGKGKRTGVYGAYLLACYDADTEEFQSVCKIGTGFSEQDLKDLAESLNQSLIPTKSGQYNVSDQLECDVWFDAVQVWEIKAADLSQSSTHRGGVGKSGEAGRGIGLRFPRFERVRADKRPDEATTSDQILEMYYAQESIVAGGGGDDGGDVDDDDDDCGI